MTIWNRGDRWRDASGMEGVIDDYGIERYAYIWFSIRPDGWSTSIVVPAWAMQVPSIQKISLDKQ